VQGVQGLQSLQGCAIPNSVLIVDAADAAVEEPSVFAAKVCVSEHMSGSVFVLSLRRMCCFCVDIIRTPFQYS